MRGMTRASISLAEETYRSCARYCGGSFLRIRIARLPSGTKSTLRHLELGVADLLHALAAKAHQAVGIAFVDHQAELLDRPGPVGSGLEDVIDALLAEGRAELAAGGGAGALDGSAELGVKAIAVVIILVPMLAGLVRRAERSLYRAADARLVAMLDQRLGHRRKGLLPVIGRLQRPARREMPLHAAAQVVFLGLGEPEPQQFVPFFRRQPVERFVGARQMRCKRQTERPQVLRTIDADRNHALLDLDLGRLAVDAGAEVEKVDGIVGRERDVVVRTVDFHIGHRERHQHRDVAGRFVEEAVADPDLLRGDVQILRTHLDIRIAHEDEPAGRQLGGRVVGEGRRGSDGRGKQRGRELRHTSLSPRTRQPRRAYWLSR